MRAGARILLGGGTVRRVGVVLLPFLLSPSMAAMNEADRARLQLSDFRWGDVQVGQFLWQTGADSLAWTLQLQNLAYGELALGNLSIDCEQSADPIKMSCSQGRWQWSITSPDGQQYSYQGQLQLDLAQTQWLRLEAAGLQLSARGQGEDLHWQFQLSSDDLSQWMAWWPASLAVQPAIWQGGLSVSGSGSGQAAHIALQFENMDFDSVDGLVATGAMNMALEFDLAWHEQGWQLQSQGQVGPGAVLWHDFYVEFAERAAEMAVNVGFDRQANSYYVEHLAWQDAPALTLVGHGLWAEQALQDLQIEALEFDLAAMSQSYLSGFLAGAALSDLELAGQATGQLSMQARDVAAFQLQLKDIAVTDGRQRFAIAGLNGLLNYGDPSRLQHSTDTQQRPDDAALPGAETTQPQAALLENYLESATAAPLLSKLSWQELSVWGLSSADSSLQGYFGQDQFRLAQSTRLPLLDGALRLDDLRIQRQQENNWQLQLDAEIEPIDMGLLTQSFGWPAFGGTLAGRLPGARYQEGVLSLDGALDFEIFGGRVRLQDLALERVFGSLPSMSANLSVQSLDLEPLTQAFSFGRITGLLDGEVRQLRLLNWQPVAFDAHIRSISDGRISQRAVDNLSKIGGGGGAALGGIVGFLFEEFPYSKLGLSCRLHNNICYMGGVEASSEDQSYYLVKGRGLPRITIKGFQQQVDWPVFLNQLKQIIQGPGSPQIN